MHTYIQYDQLQYIWIGLAVFGLTALATAAVVLGIVMMFTKVSFNVEMEENGIVGLWLSRAVSFGIAIASTVTIAYFASDGLWVVWPVTAGILSVAFAYAIAYGFSASFRQYASPSVLFARTEMDGLERGWSIANGDEAALLARRGVTLVALSEADRARLEKAGLRTVSATGGFVQALQEIPLNQRADFWG